MMLTAFYVYHLKIYRSISSIFLWSLSFWWFYCKPPKHYSFLYALRGHHRCCPLSWLQAVKHCRNWSGGQGLNHLMATKSLTISQVTVITKARCRWSFVSLVCSVTTWTKRSYLWKEKNNDVIQQLYLCFVHLKAICTPTKKSLNQTIPKKWHENKMNWYVVYHSPLP